ncbi:MAG: hypothetical protein RIR97_1688 [Pseudomonadota bacterium]
MQILLLVSVGLAGYLLFRKFVADAETKSSRPVRETSNASAKPGRKAPS